MKFKDAPSGQAASAKVEDEGVALRVTSISTQKRLRARYEEAKRSGWTGNGLKDKESLCCAKEFGLLSDYHKDPRTDCKQENDIISSYVGATGLARWQIMDGGE